MILLASSALVSVVGHCREYRWLEIREPVSDFSHRGLNLFSLPSYKSPELFLFLDIEGKTVYEPCSRLICSFILDCVPVCAFQVA